MAGKYTDEYGLPREYAANLREKMNQHYAAAKSAESSHHALHVVAEAQGNGILSDRTSNINAEVYATIECIGEPNPEILKTALIQEIETTRSNLNHLGTLDGKYIIKSTYGCPSNEWCNAELSWDSGEQHPMASVEFNDRVEWQIVPSN